MITELSPLLKRASVDVDPKKLNLQKGGWVKFANSWPSDQQWAAGKSFEVVNTPLIVNYPISRIVPGGNYCDLDLSNLINNAPPAGSLQMYPASQGVIYQIAVGIKKANGFVQVYIPANKYLYTVGSSSIFPDITSNVFRYLGAKYPEDSPAENPLWNLYTVYNMPAIILRLFADGSNFEKMTLEFKINKCQLVEKALTPEQSAQATLIQYYTDLVGY